MTESLQIRRRSSRCTAGPAPCNRKANISPATLAAIVDEYLANEAIDARREAKFFGDRSLRPAEAVARAAHCRNWDGLMHPHQRRLGKQVAATIAAALAPVTARIAAAPDFPTLYAIIDRTIRPLERVGQLAVYDIAERIGHYLGLEPDIVYLHCGVREGAQALGLRSMGPVVSLSELPSDLQRLKPAQVEDILCIYKSELRLAAHG